MKFYKIICFFILIFILLQFYSFAHSGKTDSNGGHYDYSTGEYHYHHGYSAHQHISGYCPYIDSYDKWLPSICPKCKATINFENEFYCFECGYDLTSPYDVILLSTVDGSASKTRNEYFKEVQELEEKIEELKKQNENLSKRNTEYIEEKNKEIADIKSQKQDIIIVFSIITIIISLISFNFGKNQN